MTRLHEPPWQRIGYPPTRDALRPLSRLADPGLTTAAIAYLRDLAVLTEAQKKQMPTRDDKNPKAKAKGDGKGGAQQAGAGQVGA